MQVTNQKVDAEDEDNDDVDDGSDAVRSLHCNWTGIEGRQ